MHSSRVREMQALLPAAVWQWRPPFTQRRVSALEVWRRLRYHEALEVRLHQLVLLLGAVRGTPERRAEAAARYNTLLERLRQAHQELGQAFLPWLGDGRRPWVVRLYARLERFGLGRPLVRWAHLWYRAIAWEYLEWRQHVWEAYLQAKTGRGKVPRDVETDGENGAGAVDEDPEVKMRRHLASLESASAPETVEHVELLHWWIAWRGLPITYFDLRQVRLYTG